MINASSLLRSLRLTQILTPTGRPNVVLSVEGDTALVATDKSPNGEPVPVASVQAVLDRLAIGEPVRIEAPSIGYRSAFIGAVVATLPHVEMRLDNSPPIAQLIEYPGAAVLQELERRLEMWASLIDQTDPARAQPGALRALGIYGGASGIWTDVGGRRLPDEPYGATVAVLHTGRHYPDDLSDDALLYHYPKTDRPPGRDKSEVEATKAAQRLRLPIFVVLQIASHRSVRFSWVVDHDDESSLFLIEFGRTPAPARAAGIEPEPEFVMHQSKKRSLRMVGTRPNQQRFKFNVLHRYGKACAVCRVSALELLNAAHLVPDSVDGTDDPRNGLPMCANHHAALDRGLIALDPSDYKVWIASPYSARELQVTRQDLRHLPALPAPEAITYRWERRGTSEWQAVPRGMSE